MRHYTVCFQAQAQEAPEHKVLLSYVSASREPEPGSLMPPWALSFLEDAISCDAKPDTALCIPYKPKLGPDYLIYKLL